MLSVDYTFYTEVYGGTSIPQDDFDRVINRALGVLNGCTAVNLFEYDFSSDPESQVNRLKMALCNTADAVLGGTDASTGLASPPVASESIAGTWSRSYAVASTDSSSYSRLTAEVQSLANNWLVGTPYVYGPIRLCI